MANQQPTGIWQCSANPKHRGWRDRFEPRGTCDYCLARTYWEQEIVMLGEREHAPPRLPPIPEEAEWE